MLYFDMKDKAFFLIEKGMIYSTRIFDAIKWPINIIFEYLVKN